MLTELEQALCHVRSVNMGLETIIGVLQDIEKETPPAPMKVSMNVGVFNDIKDLMDRLKYRTFTKEVDEQIERIRNAIRDMAQ